MGQTMVHRVYRWIVYGLTLLVLAIGVILRLQDAGVWPGSRQEAAAVGSWGPTDSSGGWLRATFLGQDGEGRVGIDCTRDIAPDNIPVAVAGLRTDVPIASWEVYDVPGFGHWVLPCNGRNWWLEAIPTRDGGADLYLKPHRNAPDGTDYRLIVHYADGATASTYLTGTAVRLRPR
jgi:hypothetical protein